MTQSPDRAWQPPPLASVNRTFKAKWNTHSTSVGGFSQQTADHLSDPQPYVTSTSTYTLRSEGTVIIYNIYTKCNASYNFYEKLNILNSISCDIGKIPYRMVYNFYIMVKASMSGKYSVMLYLGYCT